jgi:hypothetical protein
MTQSREPSGVLVVRAWVERGDPATGLRARITYLGSGEPGADVRRERTVASPDEVLTAVRHWLDTMLADP